MIRRVKGNQKVRNATKCEYNGIKFRSRLELFCYQQLEKVKGITFFYENNKEVLLPAFSNRIKLYEPNSKGDITEYECKFREMTYTADYGIFKPGFEIVLECKGMQNDAYPLKKKLFLHKIGGGTLNQQIFMEPHSQKQVLQCIEIIKNL